jgi:hypothetical protein
MAHRDPHAANRGCSTADIRLNGDSFEMHNV